MFLPQLLLGWLALAPASGWRTLPTSRSIFRLSSSSTRELQGLDTGALVEYFSAKGTKQLCLVQGRQGNSILVINETKNSFLVPHYRVSSYIQGKFVFGDLLKLNEIIAGGKSFYIERLWESVYTNGPPELRDQPHSLGRLCELVYGTVDPVRIFATYRLMTTYGSVFFAAISSNKSLLENQYLALRPHVVQANIRDRAALREFKQRFLKISTQKADKNNALPEIPERVADVLMTYVEGLKQIVAKSHQWTKLGWSRVKLNATEVSRGCDLLEFLGLAPSGKNARKVLEVIGVWNSRTNVEKFLMQLRDAFPPEVLEEAQYILDNFMYITDMDERIRRDLRYLRSYTVDREGAAEVDDAVSVEHIDEGGVIKEKLWIHIADVSRWIKPGSQLSLEAERRMSSIYMPGNE